MVAQEGEIAGLAGFFFERRYSVGCAVFGGVGGVGGGFAFERDGLQHEGLGEEGTADAGLFANGADAEGGEALGADETAAFEEEECCFFFMVFLRRCGLDDYGA